MSMHNLTSLGVTTGVHHTGRNEHFGGLIIPLVQGQISTALLGLLSA